MTLFLAMISWMKHQKQRQQKQTDKWEHIKLRSLCTGEQQQSEKVAQRMGEIFTNHMSEEDLMFKIHKELLQLTIKKINLIKKWAKANAVVAILFQCASASNRHIAYLGHTQCFICNT